VELRAFVDLRPGVPQDPVRGDVLLADRRAISHFGLSLRTPLASGIRGASSAAMDGKASPFSCPPCRSDLAPMIHEGTFWRLVLTWNQDRLGPAFLALRRHVALPTALPLDAWTELRELLPDALDRQREAFKPARLHVMSLGHW